jgi:apolipoprotein N-acyltransferase
MIRDVMKNKAGSVYFRGTKTVEITRDTRWVDHPSFYTRHGDWFVGVSFLLVLLGFAAVAFELPAAKSVSEDESPEAR